MYGLQYKKNYDPICMHSRENGPRVHVCFFVRLSGIGLLVGKWFPVRYGGGWIRGFSCATGLKGLNESGSFIGRRNFDIDFN